MLLGGLSSDLLLVLTDIGAAYIFQVELYKVSNINEMCWDCRAVRFFCAICNVVHVRLALEKYFCRMTKLAFPPVAPVTDLHWHETKKNENYAIDSPAP